MGIPVDSMSSLWSPVKIGSISRDLTVVRSQVMVKTGHPAIRPVRFDPPTPDTGDVEVLTLERMRVRGGPTEFLTSQRLDFDLLIRIDAGRAVHTIDFTDHDLGPGDVLWVHTGQVHRWGRIGDIDGPS